MKITADFEKITGKIKPMHAIGQPPMQQVVYTMMHYITEAGIPYSRLHDTQGARGGGLYVDIPNIFPDFDADVNDPASYEFAFTDEFIRCMYMWKVEPFYRLGVTIENYTRVKPYRIYPPKDFQKWAEICEHIIAHYNEGWADGHHYGIKYWEIWNEPDDANAPGQKTQMWLGTKEQYYELYTVTAKHLKAKFGDSIQVGGYASCGFYNWDIYDPDCKGVFDHEPTTQTEGFIDFGHRFFQYIREHNAPIDFFSWHSYLDVKKTVAMARYTRRVMEKYGYADVPDILNEWNTCPNLKRRSTDYAAAQVFGMMLEMQKTETSMLMYYDARANSASQYGGMFNPDTHEPYLAYFPFKLFNDAYELGDEVATTSDDEAIAVCGATGKGKKRLLIVNTGEKQVEADFDIPGVDMPNAEIIMTNCEYKNTITGKHIADDKLLIPPYTCIEIRF